MSANEIKEKVRAIIQALSRDEQLLFRNVLLAEREKLHMSKPLGINDDLERVVREVIK